MAGGNGPKLWLAALPGGLGFGVIKLKDEALQQ